jgi:hypothetical protein
MSSKIGLMKIPTLTLNFMEIACARTQECFGTVIVGLCKTGFQGKAQNPGQLLCEEAQLQGWLCRSAGLGIHYL